MRIAIAVIAYARMDFLKITMPRLLECRGIEKYPVYIAQDGGSGTEPARKYLSDITKKNKSLGWVHRYAPKRVGLPPNFVYGVNETFDVLNAEAVVIMADDILFSKDIFEFMEWALPKASKDKELFGVSAHSPERVVCTDEGVGFRPKLNFMGGAMCRDEWKYFFRYWLKDGWAGGGIWSPDACIDNALTASKRMALYPTNARATHIGWYGTNTPKQQAIDKGWDKALYTRCPNFKDDHNVKEYKLEVQTKIDARIALETRLMHKRDNPFVKDKGAPSV